MLYAVCGCCLMCLCGPLVVSRVLQSGVSFCDGVLILCVVCVRVFKHNVFVCCACDAECDGVCFVLVCFVCLCVVSVAYCLMLYGLVLCSLLRVVI